MLSSGWIKPIIENSWRCALVIQTGINLKKVGKNGDPLQTNWNKNLIN